MSYPGEHRPSEEHDLTDDELLAEVGYPSIEEQERIAAEIELQDRTVRS
jgi:hypothetical protein